MSKMKYTDILNSRKADISVFYKTVDNLKLPLQVFLPDSFNKSEKYKTVIAIHGGGWRSLKKTPDCWNGGWMANNVKYYAEKGYVGIVFSYRDLRFTENSDVGDLLKDCRDALKYIADNFSFADKENILIMGDSAGAHLALCLGMCLPDGQNSALKPNRIIACNPITDCVEGKWNHCAENTKLYSPVHNIKRIDADVLIMHGTEDATVSIEDSRIFTNSMKALGNNISMIEIPGAKHAFILFGYTADEKDVLDALKLADEHFGL